MATAEDYASWIVKNADKKGTPEFATVAAAYQAAKQDAPATDAPTERVPERSTVDNLKRAAGLTARYGVEGIASLPGMVIDPLYQMAGQQPWTKSLSNTLTNFGLPEPETPGEKVSGEISRGLAGGGGLGALAQKAAAGAKAVPGIVRSMAAAPTAEMLAQGGGAGVAQTAREAGAPEWAALTAGVVAPMGAQGAMGATKAVAGAANELRRPLTRGGAEQIAADSLGRLTQDKSRSLRNIDEYLAKQNVGVPGSKPTSAAVAGDYGLAGGEQLISRGDANPRFSDRRAENNAARLADVERLGATTKNIERLTAKRDELTAPMREQAFASAAGPVDLDKVRDSINRLRKTPAGGKQETARALDALDGWVVTRQAEGRVGAQDAYGLHQDINDLIRGKVQDEKGAVRLAGGMATEVKYALAGEIEKVAPGFRRYLNTYSRLSRPIERLEVIRDRLGDADLTRVTNAVPQVTDAGAQFPLSQDKMRRAVPDIKGETRLAGRQSDILERVLGDLNADAFATRGGKLPGSDTYQNIASANLVNRVLGESLGGSGLGRTATSVLGKVTPGGLERRINDMIIDAYLDPKKMRELLAKARTSRESPSLTGLLGQGGATGLSGLLGGISP